MYLQEMINFSKKGERNLFVARDEEWKIARQTLSPSFSSLKLKAVSDQCRYLSCRQRLYVLSLLPIFVAKVKVCHNYLEGEKMGTE